MKIWQSQFLPVRGLRRSAQDTSDELSAHDLKIEQQAAGRVMAKPVFL
jgi:hypothetical protein